MQMIADGKIKEGTKINRINYYDIYKYVFKNGDLYFNGTSDTLRNFFKIKTILEQDFEILEDKTEEIEEKVDWKDVGYVIGKIYKEFRNGFEEGYTSKETNCMTD